MSMTYPLALRPHRLKALQSAATQQLIAFTLYQERFALPVRAAKKVVAMGNFYGYDPNSEINLMLCQNQEITVINVERRIFGKPINQTLLPPAGESFIPPKSQTLPQGYVLIVQPHNNDAIGLAIATLPTLHRIPEAAIVPLSASYLSDGSLRCVSSLITLSPEESPLFLLDLNQLLQR